jgi:hypothetical protein
VAVLFLRFANGAGNGLDTTRAYCHFCHNWGF